MAVELKQTEKAAPLFDGWKETIIWSCLQGVMGKIFADAPDHPVSAMALLGDFCFLAGKPDRELVLHEHGRDFLILIPKDQGWADLIEECYRERAKKITRYAMKKEPDVFDREMLRGIVAGLPDEYTLQMMDEPLFRRCRESGWCRDLVSQYKEYSQYQKYGLGAVILKNEEIVSGASSYSGYLGGIEIEIDTREDHRRKGLASICGAKLILACLERGWYPGWDAHHQGSAALAEKLGYHLDYAYTAYEMQKVHQDRITVPACP